MDYFSRTNLLLKTCVLFILVAFTPLCADTVSEIEQLSTAFCVSSEVKAYLLMDAQSGQVIKSSKLAEMHLPPASLTKMMTIYLVAHALKESQLKLSDKVKVSERAASMEGSRMFIAPFSSVRIKDLIQGVIVQSGNDASVALAEHLAGSEQSFVDRMNEEARKLKMTATQFKNATGLPQANHYTTALDMAKLARCIILDYPEYYHWYAQKSFTYSNIHQLNRNSLLALDESVDGIKTGETKEAGYCLAASAAKENMRLIVIVMGAPSKATRAESAKTLLDDGFRLYKTKKHYTAGTVITRSRIWKGSHFKVNVGVAKDLYITTPRGCTQVLDEKITIKKPLVAPLCENEVVGELEILLKGECLTKVPLITLESISEGTWLNKQMSRIVLFGMRKGH